MKIDTDGLKAMYQDRIRRKEPSSITDCPSPEKIVRLLRSGSSKTEATELIDHISRCSFCCSEFESILNVIRSESDFIEAVNKHLFDHNKPERLKEARLKMFGWRNLVAKFSWRAALILASFLFVGLFLAKAIFFQPSHIYRTGSLTAVKVVRPAGGIVSKGALHFRWKEVNNSEYYILELFDQELARIWKSDKITGESAAPPKEIIKSLDVNRSYFWMVTAYFKNEAKISSRPQKFVLKE